MQSSAAKRRCSAKVGTDTFGKLLTDTLRKVGIETKGLVASDEFFTTLAFVTLDENGDREFAFARKPGADTQLRFDELDLSIIDEARVFHFGTLSLTDEPAKKHDVPHCEVRKSTWQAHYIRPESA